MKVGDKVAWVRSWDNGFYGNPAHEHRMSGTVLTIEEDARLVTIRRHDGEGYRDFLVPTEDVRP